jgi:hypothetical protein
MSLIFNLDSYRAREIGQVRVVRKQVRVVRKRKRAKATRVDGFSARYRVAPGQSLAGNYGNYYVERMITRGTRFLRWECVCKAFTRYTARKIADALNQVHANQL